MAGSLLGPDQIRRINAAFPALVIHLRSLLVKDHTGVGLMRVHAQVESFDSDEMARIFRELSFISPFEKKALVRAAVYQLMVQDSLLFVAPIENDATSFLRPEAPKAPEAPKVFTPPQFNLNAATSGAAETAATDTKPTPPPATSTHTSKVADQVKAGDKAQAEQKVELEKAAEASRQHDDKVAAAVRSLKEQSAPAVVEAPAEE